jgi:cell shape-determining protein MreC
MKRKQLETIVLVAGVLVIGVSLFFMLTGANSPIISNMIFPFGFLVYIGYSIMNTSSLQKEIRGLTNHVDALKAELKRKETSLKEKEAALTALEEKQQELEQLLNEKEALVKKQTKEISTLKTKLVEKEAPNS